MIKDPSEISLALTAILIERQSPETVADLQFTFDTAREAVEQAGDAAPLALALLVLAGKVLTVRAPLETFAEFARSENARYSYVVDSL